MCIYFDNETKLSAKRLNEKITSVKRTKAENTKYGAERKFRLYKKIKKIFKE